MNLKIDISGETAKTIAISQSIFQIQKSARFLSLKFFNILIKRTSKIAKTSTKNICIH